MSTIESKLKEIRDKVTEAVKNAGTLEIINDLRVKVIGKKGELTEIMKSMKDIPKEEKPKFGQLVNELRNEVEELLSSTTNRIRRELRQKQLEEETIDVTLPAKKTERGHKHPNQVALEEIERIFTGMGYKNMTTITLKLLTFLQITLQRTNRIHSILMTRLFLEHRHHLFRFVRWKRVKFLSE